MKSRYIGFTSVFLMSQQPYIFSNGYKTRFSERPTQECSVGFIVPEWVEDCPSLSQIHEIYGSNLSLPTTVFVLPLKHEKVKAVKEQLSSMHPEVLLFLSIIKKLSVREETKNPKLNSVSAISTASETNFATRKNIDAESCTVNLSAEQRVPKHRNLAITCGNINFRSNWKIKWKNGLLLTARQGVGHSKSIHISS